MSTPMSNGSANSSDMTAQTDCPLLPDFPMKIGFTAIYSLIFLVGVCGNAVVIHLFRLKKQQNSFTLLVINLAACDVLYACVIVPDTIHFFFYQLLWFSGLFGEISCKIWKFLIHLVVAESVATFMLIAIDRYLSIAHVRKQPMRRRCVCFAVAMSWLVSSLLSSTELYAFRLINNDDGISLCVYTWHEDPSLSLFLNKIERNVKFILVFVLPFLIIGVLYALVIRYLWRHVVPGHQIQSNYRSRHVVKMLVTMVAIFALVWLPVHICLYIFQYDFLTYSCHIPVFLRYFLFCLAHSNCALNPCFYLIFNKDYRKDVMEIFNRAIWCCSIGLRKAVQNVTPSRATGSFTLEQSVRR